MARPCLAVRAPNIARKCSRLRKQNCGHYDQLEDVHLSCLALLGLKSLSVRPSSSGG